MRMNSSRAWALALLLLPAAACRPEPFNEGGLDALDARLNLTASQRPAWEAFRREAGRVNARWSSPDAPIRRELRAALAAQIFDRARAESAVDQAAIEGSEDARRLIEAWSRVDALLTPEQRAEFRRAEPF